MKQLLINKISEFIEIKDRDYHHLKRVLRLNEGEFLNCIDKDSNRIQSKIIKINKESLLLQKIKDLKIIKENVYFNLVIGALKRDKIENLLPSLIEIGINKIDIVKFKTSQVNKAFLNRKKDKYLKLIKSAIEQSNSNNVILNIYDSFMTFKDQIDFKDSIILVFHHENINNNKLLSTIQEIKKQNIKNIYIFIGPEGGFIDQELDCFLKYEAKILSLNTFILRSDTAILLISGLVRQIYYEI